MAASLAPDFAASAPMRNVGLPLFTVDAFTDRPFAGNPAAVCLDDTTSGLSDELMQKIAAEMNISETAFLRPVENSDTFKSGERFKLRWFTPVTEVPLCGHATLASAAVLFGCSGNTSSTLTFETASGPLVARKLPTGAISMDLPRNDPRPQNTNELTELLKAVAGDRTIQDVQLSPSTGKLLVRLTDGTHRKDLESMRPEIDKFVTCSHTGQVKGVIVTVKAEEETGGTDHNGEQYDFLSRYFGPWVGIAEDPVTGSAHTVLGGYWSKELNKNKLYGRQCSARGGDLRVRLTNDGRVDVSGQAVIVLRGTITLPVN